MICPDGYKEGSFKDCRQQCKFAHVVRRETKEGEAPHRWQDWDCSHSENLNNPCDPAICPIYIDPDEEDEEAVDRWFPEEFEGFYEDNATRSDEAIKPNSEAGFVDGGAS